MTIQDLLADYFTESDVCEALGIKKVTLQTNRCVDPNHPKWIKRGRKVLYPKTEFTQWFTGNPAKKSVTRLK